MVRMAFRWLLAPALTVLVASFVIFAALTNAPGDPVAQRLGSHATAEQAAALRHELGLDQGLVPRYLSWVGSAAHGELGNSITYRAPVGPLLGPRMQTTLLLVAFAATLAVIIGIALGVLAAMAPAAGPAVAVVAAVAVAIPGFVAAQLLIGFFALRLRWFPAGGTGQGFTDMAYHLTLPAVALALSWMAYLTQVTRSALVEQNAREHVMTAKVRGLAPRQVFAHHIARNAAPPVLTVSGLTVAGLIVGAVVVESAFGIDGMGSFLVSAIQAKDYNVVQAISAVIVVIFVAMTLLLDVVEVLLDPRLRTAVTR
jgi:peptide/nickel transport system permease protein